MSSYPSLSINDPTLTSSSITVSFNVESTPVDIHGCQWVLANGGEGGGAWYSYATSRFHSSKIILAGTSKYNIFWKFDDLSQTIPFVKPYNATDISFYYARLNGGSREFCCLCGAWSDDIGYWCRTNWIQFRFGGSSYEVRFRYYKSGTEDYYYTPWQLLIDPANRTFSFDEYSSHTHLPYIDYYDYVLLDPDTWYNYEMQARNKDTGEEGPIRLAYSKTFKTLKSPVSMYGVTGLFVRDREIQTVIDKKAYRSPDFGDNWYESTVLGNNIYSIGFDVNNYQNSVVGDAWQLHVFDKEINNVYHYTEGDTVSGISFDIDCDLNSNVTIVGTDVALYKTLKYGVGGTRVFLNESVTSVAIGGSYVSNPFFSFAPEELNDAHLYSTDSSYSTARLASNGQLLHDDYAKIGQSKVDSTYSVDRFGLVFDTSLLPDNPIISAMIRLYVIELRADIEFSVYVQGSNDYPSVPIIVGDYNYSLYTGNCGYVNSDSIQEGRYLTINLNSSGLNLINKEGYSRFIIRTNRDINGNEPTGREFIRVNQREKGGHQTPKLFVTIRKEN